MKERKTYRVFFDQVNATHYDVQAFDPESAKSIASKLWSGEYTEPSEPKVEVITK